MCVRLIYLGKQPRGCVMAITPGCVHDLLLLKCDTSSSALSDKFCTRQETRGTVLYRKREIKKKGFQVPVTKITVHHRSISSQALCTYKKKEPLYKTKIVTMNSHIASGNHGREAPQLTYYIRYKQRREKDSSRKGRSIKTK